MGNSMRRVEGAGCRVQGSDPWREADFSQEVGRALRLRVEESEPWYKELGARQGTGINFGSFPLFKSQKESRGVGDTVTVAMD
jgi:hypothetical protein